MTAMRIFAICFSNKIHVVSTPAKDFAKEGEHDLSLFFAWEMIHAVLLWN